MIIAQCIWQLAALSLVRGPECLGGDPSHPALGKGRAGIEARRNEPEVAKDYWVRNIHNPSITVFLPAKEKANARDPDLRRARELVFKAEGVEPANI